MSPLVSALPIRYLGEDGVHRGHHGKRGAGTVKAAFNKITSKPVKAIIFTHYHPDHTNGATIVAGDETRISTPIPLLLLYGAYKHIIPETTYRRGMRQFGTLLPEGGIINDGIGPRLEYDKSKTHGCGPYQDVFEGSASIWKLRV